MEKRKQLNKKKKNRHELSNMVEKKTLLSKEARVNLLAFSIFHRRMNCTTEVQLTLEGSDDKL